MRVIKHTDHKFVKYKVEPKFNQLLPHLYSLQIQDLDFLQSVRQDIVKETGWEHLQPVGLNYYPTRYQLFNPAAQSLIQFINYTSSQKFKKPILDLIKLNYPNTAINELHTVGCFMKDVPGHYTDIHLDNNLVTGIIYLSDIDDPNLSTYFYKNEQGTDPTRISTEPGSGWLMFPCQDSWHAGGNKSNNDRYGFQFFID